MGFWDRLLGREDEPVRSRAPTSRDRTHGRRHHRFPRRGGRAGDRPGGARRRSRPRARRVTDTVRKTLPRLEILGLGSYDSYSVVATATDYLPEAIGAYLRLPRDWADSRPVENGKTSLLLLIDQLDLLAITMDAIYDAANTTDAAALISHGRFLQERFGHTQAPELNLGQS